MKIAIGTSRMDKHWKNKEMSWEAFCPGPEKADKPEVWYNRSTQKEAAKWERITSTAGKKRSRR